MVSSWDCILKVVCTNTTLVCVHWATIQVARLPGSCATLQTMILGFDWPLALHSTCCSVCVECHDSWQCFLTGTRTCIFVAASVAKALPGSLLYLLLVGTHTHTQHMAINITTFPPLPSPALHPPTFCYQQAISDIRVVSTQVCRQCQHAYVDLVSLWLCRWARGSLCVCYTHITCSFASLQHG